MALLIGCQSPGVTKDKEKEVKELKKQELTVGVTEFSPNFDPHETVITTNIMVGTNVFEGLTRQKGTGEIEEGIAKKWDVSKDGKTYTFHLREAKWSDGSLITAQDFVYGWERAMAPENDNPYKFLFSIVEGAEAYITNGGDFTNVGVKAIDKQTLEVKLTGPAIHFLDLTSFVLFFPAKKEFVEAKGTEYGTKTDTMIYNGPFMIDSIDEKEVVLKKNDHYWDENEVKLEEISLIFNKDSSTVVSQYEEGKIDLFSVREEYKETYQEMGEIREVPSFGTTYISINHQDAFFKNEKIREAVMFAVDRQAVGVARDYPPAEGMVSSGIKGAKKTFREEQGNLLKTDKELAIQTFKEGLKELGLETAPLVEIVSDNVESEIKATEIIVQNLTDVGFNIKTSVTKDSEEWYTRFSTRDFQLISTGWGADYNDPTSFLNLFMSENSFEGYSNAEYDKLVKEALTTIDLKDRTEKLLKAEKILIEDDVVVPLTHASTSFVAREDVKGLVMPSFGAFAEFKWTYIE